MKLYNAHYSRLMILPILLFIAFLAVILVYPGISLGLDFTGGTRILVKSNTLNAQEVESFLNEQFNLTELKVASISSPLGENSVRIEFTEDKTLVNARAQLNIALENASKNPSVASSAATNVLNALNIPVPENTPAQELVDLAQTSLSQAAASFSSKIQDALVQHFNLGSAVEITREDISSSFGQNFWTQALAVAVSSIVLLTLVIFVFFREVIPSLAVIEAAAFDLLAAMAAMAVFNIPLSLSSIAALLALIGYSVDTDILLTTRLLKRKDKTLYERADEALGTGLTMTFTAMAAVLVLMVISYYTQILVVFEIGFVMFFGMLGDLIATWFLNAPVLLMYIERKQGVNA
ncbi:MAG: hypothetical protein HY393_00655 [Candidatus Diapherotrites archaeon]|nr:hypothetical protein [Candidatus Diapherotrites archaeon]